MALLLCDAGADYSSINFPLPCELRHETGKYAALQKVVSSNGTTVLGRFSFWPGKPWKVKEDKYSPK